MKYVWAFALVMIFAGSILPRNSGEPHAYSLIHKSILIGLLRFRLSSFVLSHNLDLRLRSFNFVHGQEWS